MSRTRLPSYRCHKASGQAVVTIRGKDHYLGKFESPKSHELYSQLIAQFASGGASGTPEASKRNLTVDEIIAAFWTSIEHSGRYRKNGEPTSEFDWFTHSFRALSQVFGSTSAASFGPRRLQELRTWMLTTRGARKPLARSSVNGRIRRVVHLFRWAASMELVPAEVWHGLQSVTGLRRGETPLVREPSKVRALPWTVVEPVLQHLSSTVAAMIRLQWLTGMRPGEVCNMRSKEIDRSRSVWVYRPEHHKTEHHGESCERQLGPRSQEVLTPFLKADPNAVVFSPQEEEVCRNLERRAKRSVPLWPSHAARRIEEPVGGAGVKYSNYSYRRAIARACRKAGVESWSPNQLRHSAGTRIRERYGIEAARAFLGHTTTDVTEIYAEQDRELVARIAGEVG